MSGPLALAAVDLGASSGRVVLGRIGPDTLELTEVSRFRNGPVPLPDGLYWDALGLYLDVLDGIRAAERRSGGLAGLAIDSWGVDYGLLDADGMLLGAVTTATAGPPRCSTTCIARSTPPGCTS